MLNRFSSWYTVIINLTTRTNVNVYSLITSNSQWTNTSKKLRAFITIPNGNAIYSSDPAIPAITVPDSFRYYDRITIINNGSILGAGGYGGAGGVGNQNGSNGGNGGTALFIRNNIFLENNGNIFGGGGGGGGGAGQVYSYESGAYCQCCNGGDCDGCPPGGYSGDPCYGYNGGSYNTRCGYGGCCTTNFCTGEQNCGSNCRMYAVISGTRTGGNGGRGQTYPATSGSAGASGINDGGAGGAGGNYGVNGIAGADLAPRVGGSGGASGYSIVRQNGANYTLTGSGGVIKGAIL
jgi:hypothetical protein